MELQAALKVVLPSQEWELSQVPSGHHSTQVEEAAWYFLVGDSQETQTEEELGKEPEGQEPTQVPEERTAGAMQAVQRESEEQAEQEEGQSA